MPISPDREVVSPWQKGPVVDCGVAPILVLLTTRSNPPNLRMLPQTLEYLRIYALERVYIEPRRQDETLKTFKRRTYNTLHIISTTETIPRVVRVMWILANMLFYLVQKRRTLSLEDYIDFMCRSRWKAYQRKNRMQRMGTYLEVR